MFAAHFSLYDFLFQIIFHYSHILFFFINLFIYFIFGCVGSALLHAGFLWLRRAGAALRCNARASQWGGFSCCGAQVPGMQASAVVAHGLQSAGSVVVAHRLSCSMACGIFPDQGSNPCPLYWQADSQPLHHQGSRSHILVNTEYKHFYYSHSTYYRLVNHLLNIIVFH